MFFSEWISDQGLTRRDAAELLGTTAATVTYWTQGKHRPSAAATARIFKITGGKVSVVDLQAAYQEARSV